MALHKSIPPVTAPVAGSLQPDDADNGGRRRGSASSRTARELDEEVARLRRVGAGELAEPLLWSRPSHRREVAEVLRQLGPIRTRASLLSSWQRESRRSPQVRLAYAIAWLRLSHPAPGASASNARRRRRRSGFSAISALG